MSSKRTAFTLVELLVVLGIIGILVALSIPAIQMAREASRRAQCANNLQNIAKGFILHENSNKFFPTGGWGWTWTGDADRGYDKTQPGGWAFNILPYIEEQATRNIGKTGSPSNSAKKKDLNLIRMGTVISLYNCPTRRRPGLFPYPQDAYYNAAQKAGYFAKTDYAANGGSVGISEALPSNSLNQPDSVVEQSVPEYYRRNPGMSFLRSMVRLRSISDGTSKTYIVGERYLSIDSYEGGANDSSDFLGWDTGYVRCTVRWTNDAPEKDTFLGDVPSKNFGGPHSSTFLMAMADGSVQQLSYTISAGVHKALGSRNQGESVSF